MKSNESVAEALLKEQKGFLCKTCGGKITKISCITHDEGYEIGHKDNCPNKQVIKEGCVIE